MNECAFKTYANSNAPKYQNITIFFGASLTIALIMQNSKLNKTEEKLDFKPSDIGL